MFSSAFDIQSTVLEFILHSMVGARKLMSLNCQVESSRYQDSGTFDIVVVARDSVRIRISWHSVS